MEPGSSSSPIGLTNALSIPNPPLRRLQSSPPSNSGSFINASQSEDIQAAKISATVIAAMDKQITETLKPQLKSLEDENRALQAEVRSLGNRLNALEGAPQPNRANGINRGNSGDGVLVGENVENRANGINRGNSGDGIFVWRNVELQASWFRSPFGRLVWNGVHGMVMVTCSALFVVGGIGFSVGVMRCLAILATTGGCTRTVMKSTPLHHILVGGMAFAIAVRVLLGKELCSDPLTLIAWGIASFIDLRGYRSFEN